MANPNTTSWSTADQGAYGMVYVDDGTPVDSSYFGTPWQDTPLASAIIASGWDINPANPYGHINAANADAILETQTPTQPTHGQ